jgi:hypothetical protein
MANERKSQANSVFLKNKFIYKYNCNYNSESIYTTGGNFGLGYASNRFPENQFCIHINSFMPGVFYLH